MPAMSSPTILTVEGIPSDIAYLTGPFIIGHLCNWALFGALTLQAYAYYLAFPNDRGLPKYLALGIYILEVLQTILATRDVFRNFGTGYGDMEDFNRVGWIWFSACVMGGILSSITQLFYAWRIWIFAHKSLVIPVIVVILSLTQMVAAICAGVNGKRAGVWTLVQHVNRIASPIWLAGTAACDIIIAVAMTYYLSTAGVGFRSTKLIIVKFTRLSIETGTVCAVCASLDLSLFLRYHDNNLHVAPSIALSKLYSNSLFALLNARTRFEHGRVGKTDAIEDLSLSLPPLPPLNQGTVHRNSKVHAMPVNLNSLDLRQRQGTENDHSRSSLSVNTANPGASKD